MICNNRVRNFAFWAAIAVAITAASMSASKSRADTPRLPSAGTVVMTAA